MFIFITEAGRYAWSSCLGKGTAAHTLPLEDVHLAGNSASYPVPSLIQSMATLSMKLKSTYSGDEDLDSSIVQGEALLSFPEQANMRVLLQQTLASAYSIRFEKFRRSSDHDRAIELLQGACSALHEDDHLKSIIIHDIAAAHMSCMQGSPGVHGEWFRFTRIHCLPDGLTKT